MAETRAEWEDSSSIASLVSCFLLVVSLPAASAFRSVTFCKLFSMYFSPSSPSS